MMLDLAWLTSWGALRGDRNSAVVAAGTSAVAADKQVDYYGHGTAHIAGSADSQAAVQIVVQAARCTVVQIVDYIVEQAAG